MGTLPLKKSDLLLNIIVALAILAGLTTIVSFILYVQARMHEQEAKEKLYQSIHFKTLFLFVVLGVIILVIISKMNL
jgi:hypothetical protein